MFWILLFGLAVSLQRDAFAQQKAHAEQFFRGIYECDVSVVDALTSEDIALSYPIFEQIYQTPAIRGREAVKNFSMRFCSRWAEPAITIHEALTENNRVVLLWSFSARPVNESNAEAVEDMQIWGGISMFYFDEEGRIVTEVGEESRPGPFARINDGQ